MSTSLPALAGLHHLKYPVSDLDVSAAWWRTAFDGRRRTEWDHLTPDGRLFAVMLEVPGIPLPVELRLAPGSAEAIAGFDPIVLAAATRADLLAWAARFDELGLEHSGVLRGILGWVLVTRDPDGTSIRIYSHESHPLDPDGSDIDDPWVAPLERDRS